MHLYELANRLKIILDVKMIVLIETINFNAVVYDCEKYKRYFIAFVPVIELEQYKSEIIYAKYPFN